MSKFVVSLDFELLWGVRDSRGEEYHQQILNVHRVIPELLSLFKTYDVACTWATVGALLSENSHTFEQVKPAQWPSYDNVNFSPYPVLSDMLELKTDLMFASKIVEQIIETPRQELASHTFCHYYCLESGQTLDEFKADLQSNSTAASIHNVTFKSLVFPRNQFNAEYLCACAENGIEAYRGNPSHWAYRAESRGERSIVRRAFRLLDAYLPLSGSLRQRPRRDVDSGMVDVPASLFLRPWSKRLSLLEPLRLWRIKWSMTRTAKKGGIFHLWWHPHNFGANTKQNLKFLEEVLSHYKYLSKRYAFRSVSMVEVAKMRQ
ncbi:polysaccharide deacetylase family protein [Desulfoluna spongiiphila]|uniref:polysaccharide deacetylase family protein n=1 Tax=Desulfoluna spongiiphila TaxID=419481 RepID=UPI00125C70CC|nr:polysaccharide deacetylase family protein [Desulfoluna spongiiphila]VVS94873.1 glycoside hydrolase/deacetylase beta/alpha-barrel [Desulfoluna spongiiphila]